MTGALRVLAKWYLQTAGLPPEAVAQAAAEAAELSPRLLARRHDALAQAWQEREVRALAKSIDAVAPARPVASLASPVAQRRALLVDDATDILVTVGAFLKAFGFVVTRARDADSALAMLAAGPAVDLLVTDHAMPGMTGKELAMQARDLHPKLRALVISGFTDSADLRALPGDIALLAKPFRRADLAQAIEMLFQAVAAPAPGGSAAPRQS